VRVRELFAEPEGDVHKNDSQLSMRVLVVEDEGLLAALLEDMLAELGCQTIGPAGTVEQALALIAEFEVDAAVLDLNLNGVQAYPVAEFLRRRGIPFIFTTGMVRPSFRAGGTT
jgi:CheY-like chemotaxis protein